MKIGWMGAIPTKRLTALINLMSTAAARKMFNMGTYYNVPYECKPPKRAYKSGGGCGTTACIAGFAGICAPRFFDVDGENESVISKKSGKEGDDALAEWLSISKSDASYLCQPDSELWQRYNPVDIKHALKLLRTYRNEGIDACFKLIGKVKPTECDECGCDIDECECED